MQPHCPTRVWLVHVMVFLCTLLAALTARAADPDDAIIKCAGYAIWGEPVRAGETVVFTKGVSWHDIKTSIAQLEINRTTGKVSGRIEITYTAVLVQNDKESRTEGSAVHVLDGTIDPNNLAQAAIPGRILIRGNLTSVRTGIKGVTSGQPTKDTFTGIVSLNSGYPMPKFPDFGDDYILIFPSGQGPSGNVNADVSRWLDTNAKKNFNYTFGIGAVKLDADSDMPVWFAEASAERYDPRPLLDGKFGEDGYVKLIDGIADAHRHVKGAATDGVTRVWTIVQCPGSGKMQFAIDANENGGFTQPQALDAVKQSLTIDTWQDKRTRRHYAFALFAAPSTFTKAGATSTDHHRDIDIKLRWEPEPSERELKTVTESESFMLVRPPVVLQHGTYDNANYCWRMFPQTDLEKSDYPAGADAMFNVLMRSGLRLPNGKPAVFTVNFENEMVNVSEHGKYTSSGGSKFERTVEVAGREVGSSSFVNLAHVLWENPGGIRNALQAYRDSGVAATQADVICHSLGGLVARLYIRGAHLFDRGPQKPTEFPDPDKHVDYTVWYYRPENFMKGDVHRLITIATTHKGSDAPGMLIPFELLSQGHTLDGRIDNSLQARFIRAFDFLIPGTIGPIDRKMVQVLLHFVNNDTGMGGAFHDQQPNSAALNAIGATPVPAHAIACVSRDEDLATFQGFYWQRMRKIFALSPQSILKTVLARREHGNESFNALVAATERTSGQIMEHVMYADSVYRPADIPEVDVLAPVKMFRSVIFGNQLNDCTVRLESALGNLTPNVDATILDNILHGYATTYPSVQRRVVELLRGGFNQFNPAGFPPAGGPTRDLPPPTVAPPPKRPEVALKATKVTGQATRVQIEQSRIDKLDTARHLANDHIIACNNGSVDMQFGFNELDDAMVQARLDANKKPGLVMISGADAERKRIDARLAEGSLRIDKNKQVSCLMRTYTPSAVIENLNTSYTVTYDYETQTTHVEVHEGSVRVHPMDGSASYEVGEKQKASLRKPANIVMPPLDDTAAPPGGGDAVADNTATSGGNGSGDTTNTGAQTTGGTMGDTASTDTSTNAGNTTDTATNATGNQSPVDNRPKGPFDREIIVMGDGTVHDVTAGTKTPPPNGEGPKRPTITIPRNQLPPSIRDQLPPDVTSVNVPVNTDGGKASTSPTNTAVIPDAAQRPAIAPPKGPFDIEIIQAPRDQPWAAQPQDGPVRNLRDLIFHQIFVNDPERFDKNTNHYNTPMISASGNRIVFGGKKIWVIDYSGNNLRQLGEVDNSVTARNDISPDGSWIATHDTTHVYAARADGQLQQVLESSYGGFYGLKIRNNPLAIYLMCATPAKARVSEADEWQPFGNGVWAVDPTTGARRHLVNFAAMAEQAGYKDHTHLSAASNGGHAFDVSEDGKRIVFALFDKTLKTTRIFGHDGTVREIARVVESQYNTITSLALSGDGGTVGYITRGEKGALFVVNFDGSNARQLLAPADTMAPFTHHEAQTQFTFDGSMWYNATHNLFVRTSDGLVRSAGYKWYSEIGSYFVHNHYHMKMNRDANRFMFLLRQEDGRLSIATMTPNPPDRGKAPYIGSAQLDPPHLPAASQKGTTFTVKVKTDLDKVRARIDTFRNGHFDEANIYYKDLRDDGKGGDETAGDGIFTAVNLKARSDAKDWTGSRTVRITVEGVDEQGMRHGASADFGPYPTAP